MKKVREKGVARPEPPRTRARETDLKPGAKTPKSASEQNLLGSHLSIAGGLFHAVDEAIELGCTCVQIFTRNQRQWRAPPLTEEARAGWRDALVRAGWTDLPQRAVSHNSYLVNLGSPDATLRKNSIALQRDELERCEALGVPCCVTHPGAHLGAARKPGSPNPLRSPPSADELAGLKRIAASLDELHRTLKGYRTVTCLETTTGSGTNLGYDFAHLRMVRDLVAEPERVAFCFDTCHVTSSGYPMDTAEAARNTLDEFDSICGRGHLRVFHLNDSKAPMGSRVDRHEHIGRGTCGLECFRAILADPAFALVPKILETPKEASPDGRPWDVVNLETLRRLISVQPPKTLGKSPVKGEPTRSVRASSAGRKERRSGKGPARKS